MYMVHMHYQVAFLFSPVTADWALEHSRFATLITSMPPQRTVMTVYFATVAASV